MEIGSLFHVVRRQPRSDVLHKNNKKLVSICPAPLPPGQDSFKQFATPGTEGLDLSPGLPGGGGMVTRKIEPCITKGKLFIDGKVAPIDF